MLIPLNDAVRPAKEPLRYNEHHLPIRVARDGYRNWPRRLRARRRAHKAFIRWYAENEPRFAIRLAVIKRTDVTIFMGFRGISGIINAALTDDEISVSVDWNGTCWDHLRFFETFPERVAGGYACRLCDKDTRPIFPRREALWRAEVFEAFLEWVNEELANAVAVSISGTPDRTTWAKLVPVASGGPGADRVGSPLVAG